MLWRATGGSINSCPITAWFGATASNRQWLPDGPGKRTEAGRAQRHRLLVAVLFVGLAEVMALGPGAAIQILHPSSAGILQNQNIQRSLMMDTFIKDGKELYPLISEGCREAGEDQYAVVALKDDACGR